MKTLLTVLLVIAMSISISYATGDTIKSFSANDDKGNLWKLEDHLNQKYLVVYFYPAALTGGWTKQAQGYRDSRENFEKLDAKVVGVSGDAVRNLKYFKEENNLNFTLLSDINGQIAELFGVKIRDGASFTTTVEDKKVEITRSYTSSRWTFVLDNTGKVIYKDTAVDLSNDNKKVIEFLESLNE